MEEMKQQSQTILIFWRVLIQQSLRESPKIFRVVLKYSVFQIITLPFLTIFQIR